MKPKSSTPSFETIRTLNWGRSTIKRFRIWKIKKKISGIIMWKHFIEHICHLVTESKFRLTISHICSCTITRYTYNTMQKVEQQQWMITFCKLNKCIILKVTIINNSIFKQTNKLKYKSYQRVKTRQKVEDLMNYHVI